MTKQATTLPDAGPLCLGELCSPLPIVQGGMGVGISLAELAGAVANQGGIGVISAACIARTPRYAGLGLPDTQALKHEILRARQLSSGVIGVNIMVALKNYEALARAAAEASADIIFAGAGLPMDLPGYVPPEARTKLVPIISSAKAAALLIRSWHRKYNRYPDAFVLEGPMAGGHLGFKPEQIDDPAFVLEALIPQVLQELNNLAASGGPRIPLIAAGGLYSGQDIRRVLSLGVQGVQMGTRFIATRECDAPDTFKQAVLKALAEDLLIVQSPVGMPGRALRNRFIRDVAEGERSPVRCRHNCITSCPKDKGPYCIADALLTSLGGNAEEGLVFLGANAWRLKEILTVSELFAQLDAEYQAV